MKCPTFQKKCNERTRTASIEIYGKNWVYEYREFVCEDHPDVAWQDERQMSDNLEEIKKTKAAAAKLKKHTK